MLEIGKDEGVHFKWIKHGAGRSFDGWDIDVGIKECLVRDCVLFGHG